MKKDCVVYRTGGTSNFEWHRTIAMSRSEARQAVIDIKRGGRIAYCYNHSMSVSIGLPETYDIDRVEDAREFPGVVHI